MRTPMLLNTPARLFATSVLAAALSACGSDSSSTPEMPSSSSSSASESSSQSSSSQSSESSSSASEHFTVEADYNLYDLAPTDFPVGVAISAANEPYSIFNHSDASERQDVITTHFNQLTAGNIMKMSYLHPSENEFTFGNADQLVDFAQSNGMSVHGHALVWHSDYQVPNFMNGYEGDWEAMLTKHVTEIVNHFDSDVVVSWDVVNEAISYDGDGDGNGWRESVFYNYEPPAEGEVPKYIEVAFQAARDANADIDLYYNDYDNTANEDRLGKTLEIAERLKSLNLIDGVGFQMHVYMDYPSISNFENAFQEVVDMGLKVKVTELDVAVVNPYGGNAPDTLTYDEELAGEQKQRFCEITKVYLDTVPADLRGGFTVWGLTDDESWLMTQFANATGNEYDDVWPLLFNADLSAKPALEGVADAFWGETCNSDF